MSFKNNKYNLKGYKEVGQFFDDEEFKKEFVQAEQKVENEPSREYIRFGGLITIATTLDVIQSMNTELIQFPLPANDFLAIAQCVLKLKDGTSFSGIGDSDGKNTVDFIAKHRCRVAETRADARALRKALGITMLAAEEMEKIDTVNNSPITAKQIEFIGSLMVQKNMTKADAHDLSMKICKKSTLADFTRTDASTFIEAMKTWRKEG